MAAIAHAMPMPRKTFTAFEPVTLPIELSAVESLSAAVLDANVSTQVCSQHCAHKRTWQTGAQRDKRQRIHSVFQADRAAKVACQIANDGRE